MRWILLDLLIAGGALAVLAVLVLRLWRRVKELSRTVTAAGETIGRATDALEAAQASGADASAPPPGRDAGPAAPETRRPGPAGRSLSGSSTKGSRP